MFQFLLQLIALRIQMMLLLLHQLLIKQEQLLHLPQLL